MARPTPIVIPGSTGMGGSWKRSETNLQLDKIAALADWFMKTRAASQAAEAEKAAGAAQVDLANRMGLLPQPQAQPINTGAGIMQAQPSEADYSALGSSKEGRDLLSTLIQNKTAPRGAEASIKIVDNVIGPDKQPHTFAVDAKGNKVADLGLTFNRPTAGGGTSSDEFFSGLLQRVAAGQEVTPEQQKALEIYIEAKRATNAIPGMLDPAGNIIQRIFPKKSPSGEKVLTPEIAAEYLKKHGDRKKAEAAARKDGYTF